MNQLCRLVWAAGALGLTGCASAPPLAVLAPIGPAPSQSTSGGGDGFLQIYSARQPAATDPATEEFFWNNDFGRNQFLHRPAHTDYVIATQDGGIFKRVRNARDINDPQPTRVSLP